MNSLPIELHNNIYKFRATYTLKMICFEYNLSFDRLCEFLQKHQAVLAGSCSIHCIDSRCTYSDMDIFVKTAEGKFPRDYYKEFLTVYTVNQSFVDIEKTPISNPFTAEKQSDYHLVYKCLGKSIDMTLMPFDPKLVLCDESKFDISCILFDGRNWLLPVGMMITTFLATREMKINQLYNNSLDKIYDPWRYDTTTDLICAANRKLLEMDSSCITNVKMKQIYDKLKGFYQEVTSANLSDKLSDMFTLNHIIMGKNYIFDNLVYIKIQERMEQELNLAEPENPTKEEFLWTSKEDNDQMLELYIIYRGWYYLLKYLHKGYVCVNIPEYLPNDG